MRAIKFLAVGITKPGPAFARALLAVTSLAVSMFVTAVPTAAHHAHRPVQGCFGSNLVSPQRGSRDAALVVDGMSGQVLYQRNAAAERHPASLTKMMTLYLLFDSLRKGDIALADQLTISRHAAAQLPVNLGLAKGMTMSVETAIKAVVVRSANDAAVAIAEAVGGTEAHFAELMTAKARQIGMRDTFYHNASGLPDALQITTANDLAILARRLAYDFPQYYPYFATLNFNYRGVTYYTHDNLLGRFAGTDGIKTGYTNASGFNLVSSVVRDGGHVIGVVMGGDTARQRDNEMVRLLSATFKRAEADPGLIMHGPIPWKAPAELSADVVGLPPPPVAFAMGAPEPVVMLSAPSYASTLSRSGEINEDDAEGSLGESIALPPGRAGNPMCHKRGVDSRV